MADNEIVADDDRVTVSITKLIRLRGRYVTWDLLEDLGIPVPNAARFPREYKPCKRCQIVLGTYAKGFCPKCYIKEKNKLVDLQGRELHSQYHTPPCDYCKRTDERTYQYTDGTHPGEWYCAEHTVGSKRESPSPESSNL